MRRIFFPLFVVGFLSLQGCTGFGETRPAKLDAVKIANQGMIFGSISRPNVGRGFHRYTLYFKPSGSRKLVPVSVNAHVPGYSLFTQYTDPDLVDGDFDKWLFVKVLPPGEYELVKFETFFNQGGMATSPWSPKKGMHCRLSVKPNKRTYVGEHAFIHRQGKTLIGITVPTSPAYAISNSEADDLGLAQEIFPATEWAPYSTAEFVGGDIWMNKCKFE